MCFKIGKENIKTNIFLAPMSGCTDFSFRLISRMSGAKLCFFEMIDANAIIHRHPGTEEFIRTNKKDRPIAAQLVGAESHAMLEAALRLQDLVEIAFLDVNCACPAKKVVRKGAGAHLLRDEKRLCGVLKTLSANLSLPVTAKIRTGFTKKNTENAVRIATRCEENGASLLFVHGRTRAEGYAGEIDYPSIKAIKKSVSIPVFGSGNIFGGASAKRMLEETGCDGILVARGALGNPWIFREIEDYLKSGKITKKPPLSVRKKMLKRHLSFIVRYKNMGKKNKIGFMGKVAMWYLKGLPKAGGIRQSICAIRNHKSLENLIDRI